MRNQILYYAIRYDGDWKKIKKALDANEDWKRMDCEYSFVTIIDECYPEKLKRLECPPWILFYIGNFDLINNLGIGIVGSRIVSNYGREMCQYITTQLKERYVIISGLAKGIDGEAHKTALDKQTIGVIGCGIDNIYPLEHASLYAEMKKHHLIISEYPPGSKPYAFHFPWRNRIIAALSDALVVIEAKKRSGSMLSVNEALALDIPVYCVPHNFNSIYGSGCNLLISQGANILVDDEDIAMI